MFKGLKRYQKHKSEGFRSNSNKMILSKCAICDSKKSRFIKNQEAKGLLNNLGVRTPLINVPVLGNIFF